MLWFGRHGCCRAAGGEHDLLDAHECKGIGNGLGVRQFPGPRDKPQRRVGTYTVRLEVLDANGATSNLTKTVAVALPPVVVALTTDHTTGQAPLVVAVTSTVTSGTAPSTYEWDFGDGTTSTEANPSHTYTQAGTYSVTLTVTDVNGKSSVQSTTVTVAGPTTPPGGGFQQALGGVTLWIILAASGATVGLMVLLLRRRRGPKGPFETSTSDQVGPAPPPTG